MKFLFDYFPIICFFIAYKFWGIYVATAVAMAASALQLGTYRIIHHRFEKLHIITFVFIIVLGSLTLIFHNAIFVKWKPTIVYWVFAGVLLGTHFFDKKTLIHRMLNDKITLPDKVWPRLNMSWAIFFLVLGILNIYVVYNYNTNTWVNFKLFGTLGLMLIFIIGQVFYIAKHMKSAKKVSK